MSGGGVIAAIEPHSIAEDVGWRPGDRILSINGHTLSDAIDYRFYSAEECVTVTVRRGDQTADFEIEKEVDTPLGIDFEDILFDGVRTCGAHCVFCFVEQLPRGMRRSLYLKDDDFRLSFLHGNFVTLGNVSDDDLRRIVTQRLSPLYISVHTTDPALRDRMLGRQTPDILRQIDTLAAGRITLHTQIVLCRGINDGEQLDRAVRDLATRHPGVASIAIVPAGISSHRRHPLPIPRIDPDYSSELLRRLRVWQREFAVEKGTRLVWAADEFYLSAGRRVPAARAYEGFPQIENGIGLVRRFLDSGARARRRLPKHLSRRLRVSLVTGELAAPVIRQWSESLDCANLEIEVWAVRNDLFGETVTVAGLMTGRDVIRQLSGVDLGDVLFVPSVALREGVLLDDVSLAEVERALGVPVLEVEPLPGPLVRRILK